MAKPTLYNLYNIDRGQTRAEANRNTRPTRKDTPKQVQKPAEKPDRAQTPPSEDVSGGYSQAFAENGAGYLVTFTPHFFTFSKFGVSPNVQS